MSDISDFIFTSIKNKLPDVNWNIGSMIRELIASPIVSVAETAVECFNKQASAVSIRSYVEDPDNYQEDIEQLYLDLGFIEGRAKESTGTVTIFTNSSDVLPVFSGTAFTFGDHVVYASSDVFPALTNDTNETRFVQLRTIGVSSYAFDVPVSSMYLNVYLSEGTLLSWAEAPDYVYNIMVSSGISGGRASTTLKEKAEKIKDYVSPHIVSMDDGMTKLLRTNLPDIVVDAKFAKDHDSYGTSYLYIKTRKMPSMYTREAVAQRVEDGLYKISYSSYGVIDLVSVLKGSEVLNVKSYSVKHNKVEALVTLSGDATETVTLQLTGLEDCSKVQEFLDGYFIGSPYRVEVKAPTILLIGCQFKYTGDLAGIDINMICESIQEYTLNEIPNDTKISGILSTIGATLDGPVTFIITTNKGDYYKYRSLPMLPVMSTECFAIYTSADRINATNV